jgi:hypothetical protein
VEASIPPRTDTRPVVAGGRESDDRIKIVVLDSMARAAFFCPGGKPRQLGTSVSSRKVRQSSQIIVGGEDNMAEREGFEPTIPVKVCPLSRRIVSTAHAPLRRKLSDVS